jgi:hypothetical protein
MITPPAGFTPSRADPGMWKGRCAAGVRIAGAVHLITGSEPAPAAHKSQKMKLFKNLILAGIAFTLLVPGAQAQYWFKTGSPVTHIHKKAHVDQIQPGSQLVLVCKSSDTVTLIDIKDRKQAIKLCTEGTMIHCRDCRKKFKVVWRNPTKKGAGAEKIMQIVNEKGEPCMFLARIK